MKRSDYKKNVITLKKASPVFLLALLLAIGMTYKFSPGLMSYDSLVQYQQTVGTKELNDAHPVIMVYLWRFLLKSNSNPGTMLAFWQAVYWLGIAVFSCLATQHIATRLALLIAIGLCPPLAILSLHVWKDVGMMCALGVAATALLGYTQRPNFAWLITSVFALFFATAIRINGFIPASPLLLLTCYFYTSRVSRTKWQAISLTTSFFIVALTIYGLAINLINSEAKKSYGIGTLIVWDMASISLSKDEDLLPKYLQRLTEEDTVTALKKANSAEANYPCYAVISPYPPKLFQKQLIRDWFDLITTHPKEYLQHRTHVFSVILGLHNGKIYYPYHPGIDANEFNIRLTNITKEELADYFNLFDKISATPLYKPWIYILFGVIAFISSGIRLHKKLGNQHTNLLVGAISLSGLISAASLLFIATAADYRYITWTILSALLACVTLGSNPRNSDLE